MRRTILGLIVLISTVLAGCGGGGGASSPPPDTGDTSPPVVSSIAASPLSTGAVITWATDESTTGQINYGTTVSYGSRAQSPGASTAHSITLNSLTPDTTYHYQVKATDGAGNTTLSSDRSFTTTTAQQTVSYDVSIIRPDKSYSMSFTYDGGAYYKPGASPDWTTTATMFGRAFSTSAFDPYIAVRLSDFMTIPAVYVLTPGGSNYVELSIYVTYGDRMDKYISQSGTITISQVGGVGRNWIGSFSCDAYCAATGKTLHASGSFDLPHTTATLPATL